MSSGEKRKEPAETKGTSIDDPLTRLALGLIPIGGFPQYMVGDLRLQTQLMEAALQATKELERTMLLAQEYRHRGELIVGACE